MEAHCLAFSLPAIGPRLCWVKILCDDTHGPFAARVAPQLLPKSSLQPRRPHKSASQPFSHSKQLFHYLDINIFCSRLCSSEKCPSRCSDPPSVLWGSGWIVVLVSCGAWDSPHTTVRWSGRQHLAFLEVDMLAPCVNTVVEWLSLIPNLGTGFREQVNGLLFIPLHE